LKICFRNSAKQVSATTNKLFKRLTVTFVFEWFILQGQSFTYNFQCNFTKSIAFVSVKLTLL